MTNKCGCEVLDPKNIVAHQDHIECKVCGYIRTDWGKSWGKASGGKWFLTLHHAIQAINGGLESYKSMPAGIPELPVQLVNWMPISTCPRDESEFLAYDSKVMKMDVCYAGITNGIEWLYPTQSDGYEGPHSDEFGYDKSNITHWMPLPKAP